MKALPLACALALAVPLAASAQEGRVIGQDASAAKFAAAIQAALTAMNDGNEAGMQLTEALQRTGAHIIGERRSSPSETRRGRDGKPVIALDASLPLQPRVLAPHIAREAAKLALADMPDCAEKRYMERSLEVRAWVELGGEPSKLPVIEPLTGYSDPKLAAEMKVWLDQGSEGALDAVGREAGVEDIPTLSGRLQQELATRYSTPELIADRRAMVRVYDQANKRFTDFLMAEGQWRQDHGLAR